MVSPYYLFGYCSPSGAGTLGTSFQGISVRRNNDSKFRVVSGTLRGANPAGIPPPPPPAVRVLLHVTQYNDYIPIISGGRAPPVSRCSFNIIDCKS